MNLEVILNDVQDGVEFQFDQRPPDKLINRLEQYGFKSLSRRVFTWYVRHQHPAYINYGKALKQALDTGVSFERIHIKPSFEPSRENIDNKKFSYVSISYKKDGGKEYDNYVVFDQYKTIATAVATYFGEHKYKGAFIGVETYPRKYKRDARFLLQKGKVITGMTDQGAQPEDEKSKQKPLSENQKRDIVQVFLKFADKRISEAPQVTITDRELPLMFSGWLRQNHPGLMPQKDELWSIAERYKEKHTGSSPQEKAKDPYTNEHGVYTPQSAGHRYTEIEIPIPKTAKYEATIRTVLGQDNLYRCSFGVYKNFGDHSSSSSPLTEDDPTHNSLTEATIVAAEGIIKRLERDLERKDSILNNEEKKRKLVSKAIKAVKQYIAEISPNTKPPETTDKKPGKKSDRERLIELGFKGLFTAQNAFTMPFTVMDLQSRYYDAYQHLEEQYQKPADKQVEKWKSELEALKTTGDETNEKQRKQIGEEIREKEREKEIIRALIYDENVIFERNITDLAIKQAESLGHTFSDENMATDFAIDITKALFDRKALKLNHKKSISEITGQIVRDFFNKKNLADHRNKDNPDKGAAASNPQHQEKQPKPQPPKPDTGKNGKTKHLLNNPIIDIDDAWTMTPLEYQQMKAIEKSGSPMALDKKDRDNHEAIVKQAIEDKKAVPKRVLDQYPWLVEQAAEKRTSKEGEKTTKTTALKKFESFISKYEVIDGHLYDGELKATYETLGKAALKQLAGYLGLAAYQVNFNKAGIGVSGDLSLMGMFSPDKGIYISMNKDGFKGGVLYRSISHIKDYKGGGNNYFPESEFANPELIKEKVYRLLGLQQEQGIGGPTTSKYDYLDRVMSHLHKMYDNGKRPTKTQIEKLGQELGVPNSGMLWEAAELSWLLWYKQIYDEPLPFEVRLKKMAHFWENLQPTYAYSDSSKELYKQYSTPCPIGAMIAQYTGMDTAGSIFEPSAGNGLLLVGADRRKTHVNEIDPTRLASLRMQGFAKITSDNAAEPFDESMTKAYDVVVTNPPFTRWEETTTDKEYIIQKYFNGMMGLVPHIRLEHVMAGLALHCMKDDGKAAIIIMGHIYFSKDGYIGKYRPFFNWLYRHYLVSDVINLNSFNLYNKQGAIRQTMLILVNGRKPIPGGVAPTQDNAPHLYDMVNSFEQLWERIKPHVGDTIDILIKQLKIELGHDFLQ